MIKARNQEKIQWKYGCYIRGQWKVNNKFSYILGWNVKCYLIILVRKTVSWNTFLEGSILKKRNSAQVVPTGEREWSLLLRKSVLTLACIHTHTQSPWGFENGGMEENKVLPLSFFLQTCISPRNFWDPRGHDNTRYIFELLHKTQILYCIATRRLGTRSL